MAWANQKVFSAVEPLPEQALGSFLANEDWTVDKILEHIVSGVYWYLYCLRGGELQKFSKPSSITDLVALSKALAAADSELIELGKLNDEMLTISLKDQTERYLRSTIISQTIYHAVEHRAQLISALEFRGHVPLVLDDIDLWEFENYEAEVEKNS